MAKNKGAQSTSTSNGDRITIERVGNKGMRITIEHNYSSKETPEDRKARMAKGKAGRYLGKRHANGLVIPNKADKRKARSNEKAALRKEW